MTAPLVYEDGTSGVREIADAIAEGLRRGGAVRCVPARDAGDAELAGADLVIVGAPTRRRSLSRADDGLRRWIERHRLDGHEVLIFTVRPPRRRVLAGSALPALRRGVRRAGGVLLSAGRTFSVDPAAEQLVGVLAEARDWGRLIARRAPGWDRPT